MKGIRSAVKTAVEAAATGTGLTTLAARLRGRRAAILAYHNVVDTGDAGRGDRSLHLPLPAFRAQLDRLQGRYEFVSLRAAVEDAPGHRPRVVVTFDDAYRGAITLALPELRRRGIPATVFVAPGLLGARSTWWDALGEAGLLAAEVRERALTEAAGIESRVRSLLLRREAPPLPESYRIAAEDELLAAAGELVDLGSHSWGHEHLPSLGAVELEASLGRARDWLEGHVGHFNQLLALPYGAGSPAVCNAAVAAGHSAVLEIAGGLWTGADSVSIPRINVPAGLTPRGLELRASGLRD